jgi:hypothetical protein
VQGEASLVARLPEPGGDKGTWGTILNTYLLQAHDSQGNLKDNTVGSSQLQSNSVGTDSIAEGSVTKTLLETAVQTSLNKADTALQSPQGLPTGGGTGQILSKNSTTNYDTSWIDIPGISEALTYYTYDVRDFVNTGETLYSDGSASVSTIIQRAIDAANTAVASTGPAQIYLPAGRYRLDVELTWKSGVGLRGESRERTILLPYGNKTAIRATATAGSPLTDCAFSDFTIDGSNQTNATYQTSIKGFFIQHMLRASWRNVTVKNSWASGFGVDFLRDSLFHGCIADGNGRGIIETGITRDTALGGSGFGIGTGAFEVEAVTIADCISINNAGNGFFVEMQTPATSGVDPSWPSKGFRLANSYASNNWVGFRDAGNRDSVIVNNYFVKNQKAGISIDGTTLAPSAGYDGIVTGCIVAENGIGDSSGGGIVFGNAPSGNYLLTSLRVHHNTGFGIRMFKTSTTTFVGDHIIIENSSIYLNTRAGIFLGHSTLHTPVVDLTVSHNHFWGNGTDSGSAQRSGINIEASTTRLHILHNIMRDHAGYGIELGTSSLRTATDLTIVGNDVRGNTTGDYLNSQTLSGTTIVQHVTDVSSYSDEQSQDAIAAMFAAGTHTGVTFNYNDAAHSMSATVSGSGGSDLLAVTQYTTRTDITNSASQDWYDSTTAPTITVPSSGQIIIRFTATVSCGASSTNGVQFGIRNNLNDTSIAALQSANTSTAKIGTSLTWLVTGLTPGGSIQPRLRVQGATATASTATNPVVEIRSA